MCGIGGVLGDMTGLDGRAMLAALAHRGPDRQASCSPAPGVFLVAARLAIRDPRPEGDQPMRSDDESLALVYNGEVYNAASLRDALVARGHHFRSRGDTEVILRGYLEWGDDVVARLDGMFAFALWDGTRRRTLLARDPLGIKPLFLARGPRRLAFSSEVRPLLVSGAAPHSIEMRGVASFLDAGSVAEPHAIVRGVMALPPGSRLIVDGESLTEKLVRVWSLPPDRKTPPSSDAKNSAKAEIAEINEVRERLESAVIANLESDVPLGLLLSGGIDSAVLALIASKHARGSLRTFHVHVGEAAAKRARNLASALKLPHEEITLPVSPSSLLDALSAQDQPSVDGANTFLIARAIRAAGIKSALTGLGADELFLGYPLHCHYVRVRAWRRRLAGLGLVAPMKMIAGRVGSMMATGSSTPWRVEKLVAIAAGGESRNETYAGLRALFPSSTRRRLLPDFAPSHSAAENELSDVSDESPSLESEASRLELSGYLVNTLLRDADVMSMASGVELRVPFLDLRLVESVVAMGAGNKLQPGRNKPLLVDAVPELPREFVTARKEGFVLPLSRWLSGPLSAQFAETLGSRSAARRVGLDSPSVMRVWSRFLRRPDAASAHRAWALFALLRWAETQRVSV